MTILIIIYILSILICFSTWFIEIRDRLDFFDFIMIFVPVVNTVVAYMLMRFFISDYIDRSEP